MSIGSCEAAATIKAQRRQVSRLGRFDFGTGSAKLFHLTHQVGPLCKRSVDRLLDRVGEFLGNGQVVDTLDLKLDCWRNT